jgi:hypothetical protein
MEKNEYKGTAGRTKVLGVGEEGERRSREESERTSLDEGSLRERYRGVSGVLRGPRLMEGSPQLFSFFPVQPRNKPFVEKAFVNLALIWTRTLSHIRNTQTRVLDRGRPDLTISLSLLNIELDDKVRAVSDCTKEIFSPERVREKERETTGR